VQDDYDVILIDCKGDMGVLTLAAMQAVRPDDPYGRKVQAVCVVLPDVKSIGGLARVEAEVERLAGEGDRVELAAVIPVKIQHRNASAVADDLYQELRRDRAAVITPPVRKVATLDEAYMNGEPVTIWDPTWKVSEDYRTVIEHLRNRKVLP
jgi:cellulose biosynthesis protein BcsQ